MPTCPRRKDAELHACYSGLLTPFGGSMSDPKVTADLALAEIVRRLVAAFQPERIYLFGSKARGEAGPDSDYDLLVVVPDDASPERRRSRLGYQALRGTGGAADVLGWTCSPVDSPPHLRASPPSPAGAEGTL